jgi:glycosyltransferase involved in cell wall biosynthesis
MERLVLIIIPVYNEETSIKASIESLKIGLNDFNILFVDDGSSDKSLEVIINLTKNQSNLHYISTQKNQGYGHACRAGAEWAFENGYKWGLFADSDLTNPISEIRKIISSIEERSDLIKGNRFWGLEGTKEVEFSRRLKSYLFGCFSFIGFRFEVRDPANGFRVVKIAKYVELPLKSNDFSLILEETYWQLKKNWGIKNFSTHLGARDVNQRPSYFNYSLPKIWKSLRWPLKYWFGF